VLRSSEASSITSSSAAVPSIVVRSNRGLQNTRIFIRGHKRKPKAKCSRDPKQGVRGKVGWDMKYRDNEENLAKTTRYSSAAAHGKRDDERVKCLARVQPDGPRGEGVKAKRVPLRIPGSS